MKKLLLLIAAATLAITGCGSDGKDSSDGLADSSEVVTLGTVSRFGSVAANGVVFDSDSATVTMNDEPGNVADLRVGHVVSITGMLRPSGTAMAQTISCLDESEGPITSMNPANNSFVVLGRTVFIDELTVFENLAWDDLAVGNVVRVNGHLRNQERIQATHVLRVAHAYQDGMKMAVKGEISGLNPALMRFNIGTQSCDFSAAMLELGGATLENGLYVEVSSTSPMFEGDLILDRIQARDRDRDRDRDHQCDTGCDFDLEGYVTLYVSPTEFDVDDAPVTTTAATVYVNGTVDTLAVDVRLAVVGTLDDAGVLVAERIVFRLPSIIAMEADLEAIDIAAATVTLFGVSVATDDSTLFRDRSEAAIREFWLDDLAVGDRVEVRAYLDGNTVMATRLERDDAATGVTLKAPVQAIDRPSLTMLGVTATAGEGTVYQNAEFQVIDADTFFELVEVGSLVKAGGTYDGAVLQAGTLFLRVCANSCL